MSRRAPDRVDELERGRRAYAERAWLGAYELLTAADRHEALAADDFDLLATCAFMLGRDDESIAWLERAHHRHFEAGETRRAARSAIWVGLNLASRGQIGPATGWLGRAQRLLDESMVAVTAEELSPIVTGIVYCGVILACQEVYDVRRAREWTRALSDWWELQPELVAFTGRCLVHRAEILQLDGSWREALEEARRAGEQFLETKNPAAGLARYRQGELLRLQGEFGAAEKAYKEASTFGWEPQPGLAQLRFGQGRATAAATAIRRAEAGATQLLERVRLLPAYVEIMLAVGDTDSARRACHELEELAGGYESAMLEGIVAHARGAVHLAEGDAQSALVSLRRAGDIWQALEAPYEIARTRKLVGEACRALGDEEAAELELEAARGIFERLGAKPDLARLTSGAADAHGLSRRELEVLRLVASGKSNREIAAALVISEHTVARHLQNIFAKLDLSSRAAATAFAFEHNLV